MDSIDLFIKFTVVVSGLGVRSGVGVVVIVGVSIVGVSIVGVVMVGVVVVMVVVVVVVVVGGLPLFRNSFAFSYSASSVGSSKRHMGHVLCILNHGTMQPS